MKPFSTTQHTILISHEHWIHDCRVWYDRLLTGKFAHYCLDWDNIPVDETTEEWKCCTCFNEEEKLCGLSSGTPSVS